MVTVLAPSWQGLSFVRAGFFLAPLGSSASRPQNEELERLKQENQMLRTQMGSMREWLVFEERIEEQLQRLKSIAGHTGDDFFRRRGEELCRSLDLQMQSLPAKVIFREPDSWSSSIWLNVGEKDNRALKKIVVAKNSPVLAGSSLVGIIEEVRESKSRVRLITDSSLAPSVRAVRGSLQNRWLVQQIDRLLELLQLREEPYSNQTAQNLFALKQSIALQETDLYLAKGELHGSSQPLWRSRGQVLHGAGFNYDFADEEGPGRDLRTGASLDSARDVSPVPLIKLGDLLVTSGLDGVFPAGLPVATVIKVHSLREGACSYELEARPTAGDLDSLSDLFVLAPCTP